MEGIATEYRSMLRRGQQNETALMSSAPMPLMAVLRRPIKQSQSAYIGMHGITLKVGKSTVTITSPQKAKSNQQDKVFDPRDYGKYLIFNSHRSKQAKNKNNYATALFELFAGAMHV
ncbi:MAG: hypothetical protein ACP5UH_01580 [Candidatus Micrarchaeia archaeon]